MILSVVTVEKLHAPQLLTASPLLPDIRYEGIEGELYNVHEDPRQWRNLWNDAGYARRKSDLIADLYDHLPRPRDPQLRVEAPA